MLGNTWGLPSPAVEDRWAATGPLVRSPSGVDITAAYPKLLPLANVFGGRPAVLDG
ncbi:hypothetical protein [Streptomyces anulatus]|uniref:hypothetical protein n=1 Tax=Streptomyces anulatus TaxID=1892 RepID=UPI00356B660E